VAAKIRRGPGQAEDSSYLAVKRRDDGSGAAAEKQWPEPSQGVSLSSTKEVVGLVDSAREENKARAEVEIYRIHLKRGRYRRLPLLWFH